MNYTNEELVKRIAKAKRDKNKLQHVPLKRKEKVMENLSYESCIEETNDNWFHAALDRIDAGDTPFEVLNDVEDLDEV